MFAPFSFMRSDAVDAETVLREVLYQPGYTTQPPPIGMANSFIIHLEGDIQKLAREFDSKPLSNSPSSFPKSIILEGGPRSGKTESVAYLSFITKKPIVQVMDNPRLRFDDRLMNAVNESRRRKGILLVDLAGIRLQSTTEAEQTIKRLLDLIHDFDRVATLHEATILAVTSLPDDMSVELKNRFDQFIVIKNPSSGLREMAFQKFLECTPNESRFFSEMTSGFSAGNLRSVIDNAARTSRTNLRSPGRKIHKVEICDESTLLDLITIERRQRARSADSDVDTPPSNIPNYSSSLSAYPRSSSAASTLSNTSKTKGDAVSVVRGDDDVIEYHPATALKSDLIPNIDGDGNDS